MADFLRIGPRFRPQDPMRRRQLIVARMLLVCCGLAVGLGLCELALRLSGIAYPLPYTPDVHVGSRLQPGFQAWFTKEGRAYVRVNQAGFRDRHHRLEKPPATLRIAVLGDSFAEAVQVSQDETFWSVLERTLAGAPELAGRQVEVLNFGISGHGTAQQLQMLRHYALAYRPDIVLLAFFAGNDVRNNCRELEPDDVRPFFLLNDGQLVLDDRFLTHPAFVKANAAATRRKVAAINACRLLQLANEWKNRPPPRGGGTSYFEPGVDDLVFAVPQDSAWRNAWEVTDALVIELNRETRRRGARFVVATVTQAVQVHPDERLREAFAAQLGVPDLRYPEQRLAALGQTHDFQVIPLADAMLRQAVSRDTFLHGFNNTQPGTGHWNAAGHRLAGTLIAESLRGDPSWEQTLP